jgi:hypothetical protein
LEILDERRQWVALEIRNPVHFVRETQREASASANRLDRANRRSIEELFSREEVVEGQEGLRLHGI